MPRKNAPKLSPNARLLAAARAKVQMSDFGTPAFEEKMTEVRRLVALVDAENPPGPFHSVDQGDFPTVRIRYV